LAAKSLDVALLIGTAKRIGNIDPDVAGQTGHFSEMVHLFGRRAGNDQLIQLGRRVGQNVLDIKVRAADLAVGLNRDDSAQKILVFQVLFLEILKLYFVGKHHTPPLLTNRSLYTSID
jgi:hypothetical protein